MEGKTILGITGAVCTAAVTVAAILAEQYELAAMFFIGGGGASAATLYKRKDNMRLKIDPLTVVVVAAVLGGSLLAGYFGEDFLGGEGPCEAREARINQYGVMLNDPTLSEEEKTTIEALQATARANYENFCM